MSFSERPERRSPRRRCRLKIVTSHGLSFSLDVGEGGYCAESLRVLAPGTVVRGSVHVGGREMAFDGRVAWAKAGYPHANLKGRMGVVFTRMSPELRGFVHAP